jgi:hypothetical protein
MSSDKMMRNFLAVNGSSLLLLEQKIVFSYDIRSVKMAND